MLTAHVACANDLAARAEAKQRRVFRPPAGQRRGEENPRKTIGAPRPACEKHESLPMSRANNEEARCVQGYKRLGAAEEAAMSTAGGGEGDGDGAPPVTHGEWQSEDDIGLFRLTLSGGGGQGRVELAPPSKFPAAVSG